MSKITLNSINSLQNENTAITLLNQNSNTITSAFDNTLSRDGSQPNQMLADLDMNSNDILNLNKLTTSELILNGEEVVTSDLSSLIPIPDGTILSNISGASAIPTSNSLSSIMDHDVGNTVGNMVYRGASGWSSLNNGSSGQFLKWDTIPTWEALPGGGDMLSTNNLSDVASIQTSRRNIGVSVPDRTTLQTLDPTKITEVILEESGRSGVFIWRQGNYSLNVTADTQQGIYISSNSISSSSGAWVRDYNGPVFIEWFGAKGDGVTDDSTALNGALALGSRIKIQLKDPAAGYYIGSVITLNQPGQSIIGVPTRTNIIHKDGYDLFNFQSGDTEVHNLWIDSTNVSGSYFEFVLQTSVTNFDRVLVQNVISNKSKGFFKDDGGSNSATTVTVRSCTLKLQMGPGFVFTNVAAYLGFHDTTVDFVGSTSPNFYAWNITNNSGCIFDNCDVTGTSAVAGTTQYQAGFVLTTCSAVWFRKTQADTVEGLGYVLTNCSGIQFYDGLAGLNDGNAGFYFNGCTDVTGAIRANGRQGISGATSGINGVVFEGCTRVRMDIQSIAWTGNGVNVSTSSSVCLTSLQAQANGGWGLYTDTNGSVVVGCASFGGNSLGNYTLGRSAHGIGFMQVGSGAFLNNTVGPASG